LVDRGEAAAVLGYAPGSFKNEMRRNPERWPASIACRLRPQRALLWDRCAIEAAARSDGSVRAGSRRRSGADSDGLVTCLECGRRLRSLGYHLHAVHGTNAVDYRAEHLLPASTTLVATGTRTALSQTRKALIGERPELLERLRANLPPHEVTLQMAAEARAGTDGLALVRQARADAARRTQPATAAAARERTDAVSRAAGYASMDDAIRATASLSRRDAAAKIGISTTTVSRRRKALGISRERSAPESSPQSR
jgi:CheY-like chemotaxis protein